MSKTKAMFQSKEAKAVARTTEEAEILSDAIDQLTDQIKNATGASKKNLQVKQAEMKAQEALNNARKNAAVRKFNNRFNNNMSETEITQGYNDYVNKNLDENTRKSEKILDNLGRGADLLVQAAMKLSSIDYEREYEDVASRADILMADIAAMTEKSIMGAGLQTQAYTGAVDSAISSLTDGINEGAYNAASKAIDLGAQAQIFNLENQRIDLQTKNTKNLRVAQREAKFSDLYAQQTQAETDLAGGAIKTIGGIIPNPTVGAVTGIVGSGVRIAGGMASPMIMHQNRLITQYWENQKKISEALLRATNEVQKKRIEAAANVQKAWLQFAQKIENNLIKSESMANDLGVSMGYTGDQLNAFKKSMFQAQITVSQFGKTLEDIQKAQDAYQQATGRNIQFTANDLNTTFALDTLAGQDGLSVQLTSGMEIFNHSISDSNEMIFEMYKNVNKIGINGRKFLKDLVNNLKMAEKFQFRGGVQGLMDMAKWAQNTRFNMASLENMLESFSENGLEGAITKAAGMQVLGGRFAMYADPLAMLWERYNDPKAFSQRQQSMLRGMGTFNSKTGEVDFNMNDQIILEQFAKYTGQSVQDLMNQQRQYIRGQKVDQQLNKSVKWSEDEKSLITNKAHLKNGQWTVTMNNGQEKAVSSLNREDLNHLMPQDNEEKLVSYVYDIRSMMTRLTGAKQYATSRLENDAYDTLEQQVNQRIDNVISEFNDNYTKYLNEFISGMKFATDSQDSMFSIMDKGDQNIDGASEAILDAGERLADTLDQVNAKIQQSMNVVEQNKDNANPKNGEIADKNKHSTNRLWPYDYRFQLTWPGQSSTEPYPQTGPMVMDPEKVKPINDGIVTTNPNDTGVFAKPNGPFDKLFNGVFNRIDDVWDKVNGTEYNKSYVAPIQPIGKSNEILTPTSQYTYVNNNSVGSNEITVKPIQIKLDGNIQLRSDGQSVSLNSLLQNDPLFIRKITEMISNEIGKSINGGRYVPQRNYL